MDISLILHAYNDDGTPALEHTPQHPPDGHNQRPLRTPPLHSSSSSSSSRVRVSEGGGRGRGRGRGRGGGGASRVANQARPAPVHANEPVQGRQHSLSRALLVQPRPICVRQRVKPRRNEQKPRNRRFACPMELCEYGFPTQSELDRHVRTHMGERPFRCDVEGCGKAFAQAGGLKRHSLVHTGERPFVCLWAGCGRQFTESGNLDRHIRSHTGERPYSCRFGCGRTFTSSCQQCRHEETHVGVDPVRCVECGERFGVARDYVQHPCAVAKWGSQQSK